MHDPSRLTMLIAVQDSKLFQGEMGQCRIVLQSLAHGKVVDQWVLMTVNGRSQGEVNVRMQMLGLSTRDHGRQGSPCGGSSAARTFESALCPAASQRQVVAVQLMRKQVHDKFNHDIQQELLRRRQQANPMAKLMH
ncbi:Aste57867_10241 [Aphanomyces stellatus]|uniref:Aste57867_10241 protein n=1 Tax=Aphanomyces stellatus TaxID=120398 RepID=A0A485KQC4_9STRA|nr:hypothetical protein As57867_010202 [Aphanomyces stellatus]VFT87116.1 Aste57867_10241 [Aphanomyces stellatus]